MDDNWKNEIASPFIQSTQQNTHHKRKYSPWKIFFTWPRMQGCKNNGCGNQADIKLHQAPEKEFLTDGRKKSDEKNLGLAQRPQNFLELRDQLFHGFIVF